MNRLIVMVGLPGSGKSTFAERLRRHIIEEYGYGCEIFSSDAIREELYGDANIQGDSKEVFSLLEQRLFEALSVNDNRVAIYDATNLTAKGRKALINKVKNSKLPECYFHCIFIGCRLSECKRRQFSRDRKVPEEVIERMVRSFQAPFYNEGWDEIQMYAGGKLYNPCEEVMDALDLSHDNHHHTLSIGKHMAIAGREALELIDKLGYGKAAYDAAYYHDMGKPHVKSFTDKLGNPTEEAHYFSHESVSSYMWLSSYHPVAMPQSEVFLIAALIQWHMQPYFLAPKGEVASKEEVFAWGLKKGFSEQFLELLWIVHQADQAAH